MLTGLQIRFQKCSLQDRFSQANFAAVGGVEDAGLEISQPLADNLVTR